MLSCCNTTSLKGVGFMACVTCSSFSPYLSGGWCTYHNSSTSGGSTCSSDDGRSQSYSNKYTCSSCSSYGGGWCSYLKTYVNSNSSCNSHG